MASSRDIVRQYYQTALDEPGEVQPQFVWSHGQIPNQPFIGNLTKFGIGLGGLLAAGNLDLPSGGKVWDKYVGALRHFEEYFPAKIPRTLQLSNFFSQFETASSITRVLTPEHLGKLSPGQISYLEKLTGKDSYDLLNQGIRFEGNKLLLDRSNKTILSNASVIRNITGSHHLSTANARSLGANINGTTFAERIPFLNSAGKEAEEAFQFIGGKSKFQSVARQLGGIGTELVERVNRLARSISPKLAVKSGSGLETFGRIVGKWGILGSAAYLGYQTLDWKVRNTDLLNNTIFDNGITAAGANIYAKANIGFAKIAEATGLSDYSRDQESYAPGSTSLLKLSAFPVLGGVAGAGINYLSRVGNIAKLERRGLEVAAASKIVDRAFRNFGTSKGAIPTIGKALRESNWKILRNIGKSRTSIGIALGAAIGMLPIIPFLPGALAPSKSSSELEQIYTGKKYVAVRKGAFWELGRSNIQGENIQYFREHLVSRLIKGNRDSTTWGNLEKDGELSPLSKWYKQNFTYDVEKSNYLNRPYPITGAAFAETPIIGPILSSTIGQIVKPQKIMHREDFYSDNTGDFLQPPAGFGANRAIALGEQLPGSPINPLATPNVAGEQLYRLRQLVGLPGYLASVIKKGITGSQDFFDDKPVLQSADEMTSLSRRFYQENLGGMAFQNELFRRLLPSGRNNLETYNPILNHLASWLPGTGDRSPDFSRGDPYSLIASGEDRLPGANYASKYPELKGIDPEDYPLIHRYKILGDVAPFSEKFDEASRGLSIQAKQGRLSQEDQEIYKETKAQIDARRDKKTFVDYLYQSKNLGPVQQALVNWNNEQKQVPETPWFKKQLGSFWETISHNAETPLEYLTPLSPGAKLLHQRTATEDYERSQLYGTSSGFWDRPWENFIRPALHSTKHLLSGKNYVPNHIQSQRNVEEYFDILKYLKFTRLKNIASTAYDGNAVNEFEQERRETLFGVNPYTHAYTQIFRGLPRRDRDYFNTFVETKDMDERAKILAMIPENEKGLYIAKWRQADATDFAKATKLGILSEDQVARGEEQVQNMYSDMEAEGLPKNKDLFKEYISGRLRSESYPDWYRRSKLLPKRAQELGANIPGPDWVGFNPSVDLDDIKLKVVQNLGEEIRDYDLWPQREKQLLYKQAFINEEAVAPVIAPNTSSETDIRRNIQDILTEYNISESQVFVTMGKGNTNKVTYDIQEDREKELKERLRRLE